MNNKNSSSKPRRKRGGQPGNQNARIHGRYSTVISPREAEVLKAVASLDDHGRRVILAALLENLLETVNPPLAEKPASFVSHSSRPVPVKGERITQLMGLDEDVDAWAMERNIDLEGFMREVIKTNQGQMRNE